MSPSLASRYTTTSHLTHDSPTPSLHGIWAILSLAFVISTVTAVLLYAMYTCFRSARHNELSRPNTHQGRRVKTLKIAPNSEFVPFNRLSVEKSRAGNLSYCNEPLDAKHESHFRMSSDSSHSDITSPPLAVTYSMHSPNCGIPISPLPPSYQPPDSPAPLSFDRNNIPFITPEHPLSERCIDPKLRPIRGSFENPFIARTSITTQDVFRAKSKALPKPVPPMHTLASNKENAVDNHTLLNPVDISPTKTRCKACHGSPRRDRSSHRLPSSPTRSPNSVRPSASRSSSPTELSPVKTRSVSPRDSSPAKSPSRRRVTSSPSPSPSKNKDVTRSNSSRSPLRKARVGAETAAEAYARQVRTGSNAKEPSARLSLR